MCFLHIEICNTVQELFHLSVSEDLATELFVLAAGELQSELFLHHKESQKDDGGVHLAVALGPWCTDQYPGMQEDTKKKGEKKKEKKTLDRLLHESAVE